ncbi:hypothetical protein [Spirosoma profusum]|uniref:hypothetical protein n=1 Tax=Spirosoma profusum TaxID=2771354 RepID=UPI001CC266C5|nr:hypothetical protein [Spirosoma profusum]
MIVIGFAGVGNVGNWLHDVNFQNLNYSLGGGVRLALNRKERLNLRIDYCWGLGQSVSNGLYFQLGEAFGLVDFATLFQPLKANHFPSR